MDLDLADYDQIDEFKSSSNDQQFAAIALGHLSTLVETLSSSIDQANTSDDTQCENDYVFLPRPQQKLESQLVGMRDVAENSSNLANRHIELDRALKPIAEIININNKEKDILKSLNDNQANDLQKIRSVEFNDSSLVIQKQPEKRWPQPVAQCFGSVKPIGLVNIALDLEDKDETKHVSSLMHQIVTRADSIKIEIPCTFCREHVCCPPSDISRWLNHMDQAHNCKQCSICNKLIGLGPRRDIDIMHKHVVGHFDSSWLDQQASKTNFTFGLRQHWFSGTKCNIIDMCFIPTSRRF